MGFMVKVTKARGLPLLRTADMVFAVCSARKRGAHPGRTCGGRSRRRLLEGSLAVMTGPRSDLRFFCPVRPAFVAMSWLFTCHCNVFSSSLQDMSRDHCCASQGMDCRWLHGTLVPSPVVQVVYSSWEASEP